MAVLRRQTAGKKPPRPVIDFILMKKGAVKGVRLPVSQHLLKEDDYCPHGPSGNCGDTIGRMLVSPDGDCSCHAAAPCHACENSILVCSSCGFEYRGTAEDNVEVNALFRRNREKSKPPVDFGSFDLYAIYGDTRKGRKTPPRLVRDVDSHIGRR